MVSTKAFLLAALATVAYAAPCTPEPPKPEPPQPGPPKPQVSFVLPSTGGADLPPPADGLVLKRIAVGHGIQNYSCASPEATPSAKGALAVLYDITPLYPGTPRTGLDTRAKFDALSTETIWTKAIPLNLANPAAAAAGAVLPSTQYGAAAQPWKAPANLDFKGLPPIKFLGRHYFDADSAPTFDLSEAGLLASVGKTADVDQPASADKGPLLTGAVKWLRLEDTKGLSKGVKSVYRVITAGGFGDACSKAGTGLHSIPYTAQYWFYG